MADFRWRKNAGPWNYETQTLPYVLPGVSDSDTVDVEGIGTRVTLAASATGRIVQQATFKDGRAAVVPQSFFDATSTQLADTSVHPAMGPFSHVAVKNGNWSDTTVWNTGAVPGNGAIVNYSTYDVTYDVESDALIYGINVAKGGVFRWATDRDLRLRIRTARIFGVEIRGTQTNLITESPTLGKKRIEVIFHRMGVDPGTTTDLGWINYGPVRHYSTPKAARLESASLTVPVGATSATLVAPASTAWKSTDAPQTAAWRKGDKVLILGTTYAGTTTTDTWYDGPTQYWNWHVGSVNSQKLETNNNGYMLSQDEVVTVNTFNPITGELTWDEPLAYAHVGDTWSHPTTPGVPDFEIPIAPVFALLSYPFRFRGASKLNAADVAIDSTADLKLLQHRAHTMMMHWGDVDVRGLEILDMGRSDINPSMVSPGLPLAYSQQTGGTQVTNPNNVQGRYALYSTYGGPFLGVQAQVLKNISIWSSANEQFTPGWAYGQNHSRSLVENMTCYRFRGAGMATENATEIGQWTNCIASWARSDGFSTQLEDRGEFWRGHNGHGGIGFEGQARQILMNGNLAGSCIKSYHWQLNTPGTSNVAFLSLDAVIGSGADLRLMSPLISGGDTSPGSAVNPDSDTYGRMQPQIPLGHRNMSFGSRLHLSVIHRSPNRIDSIPMVWKEAHALRCGAAIAYGPYVNSYYLYQSVLTGVGGTGTACTFLGVAWRHMVVNCIFAGWAQEFEDSGLLVNYEGYFINNQRIGGDGQPRFATQPYYTQANDAVTYPWFNLMGDAYVNPSDPKQVKPRVWRTHLASEFPLPYPLEPYGLKLGSGYPAVPRVGGAPYFVQTSGPHTFVGGNLRNQFILTGVIRDSLGDRRLGDFMTSETWPNGANVKSGFWSDKMTAEMCVERNGCFQVGGVWKTRLHWIDADRGTGKFFYFASDDITLTGVDAGLLAKNTVNPDAFLFDTEFLPENLGAPRIFALPTDVPAVVTAATANAPDNAPLVHVLKAPIPQASFVITGGADAAKFVINKVAGVSSLGFAGGNPPPFGSPTDAGGNNVYDVTVATKDIFGQVGPNFAIVVTVLEAWVPTSASGLVGAWDSNAASLVDDGTGKVDTWGPTYGAGIFYPSTPKPNIISSGGPNGNKRVVQFPAGSRLSNTVTSPVPATALHAVANGTMQQGTWTVIEAVRCISSARTITLSWEKDAGASPRQMLVQHNGFRGMSQARLDGGFPEMKQNVTTSDWLIRTFVRNGSSQIMRINGVAAASTTWGNESGSPVHAYNGVFIGGGGANTYSGTMSPPDQHAGMLIYTTALSGTNLVEAEKWVAKQLGIVLGQ